MSITIEDTSPLIEYSVAPVLDTRGYPFSSGCAPPFLRSY